MFPYPLVLSVLEGSTSSTSRTQGVGRNMYLLNQERSPLGVCSDLWCAFNSLHVSHYLFTYFPALSFTGLLTRCALQRQLKLLCTTPWTELSPGVEHHVLSCFFLDVQTFSDRIKSKFRDSYHSLSSTPLLELA